MKPFRHLRHPARPPQFVQPALAACALLSALGLPCAQATATGAHAPPAHVAGDTTVANAGALNVTPPAALEAIAIEAPDAEREAATDAAAKPAASVFENVLREQDPTEVPLSLALMGGVLGILYVRRRKR